MLISDSCVKDQRDKTKYDLKKKMFKHNHFLQQQSEIRKFGDILSSECLEERTSLPSASRD